MDRDDFTGRGEFVFCNAYGCRLDGSALRRRYIRARDAIGLRPLRWHDLRHTFGSLLVAGGIDLVSVKDAMGHSQLWATHRVHALGAAESGVCSDTGSCRLVECPFAPNAAVNAAGRSFAGRACR